MTILTVKGLENRFTGLKKKEKNLKLDRNSLDNSIIVHDHISYIMYNMQEIWHANQHNIISLLPSFTLYLSHTLAMCMGLSSGIL